MCINSGSTTITAERFDELVEDALESIPELLWRAIDNVTVVVEEQPTYRQMRAVGTRSGHLLLGLYEGVPLTKRTHGYSLVLPDKITIFRVPILTVCRPISEERVQAQVRKTVLHEIAHHFGISDNRLRELGAY